MTTPENQPSERPGEKVLKSLEIQVEKKTFTFSLRENNRGRFLVITETNGRRSKIIVPASGINEFTWMVGDAVSANAALPPKSEDGP